MNNATNHTEPSSLGKQLLGNAAIVLPGLYLLASSIGMLDSWWYFRQFGINIFYYSDLSDFLLASFRSPTAWLVVVLSLGLFSIEYRASLRDALLENPSRFRRLRGSSRYRMLSWLCLVPMVAGYILVYANLRADGILVHEMGKTVTITLDTDTSESGTLLGSSLNFIFILQSDRSRVHVHPYDNVITVSSDIPGMQEPRVQETTAAPVKPQPADAAQPDTPSP